ncbi:MAG: TVP38/TMEM64 family protein [Syntrophobacteraceae bacterium]
MTAHDSLKLAPNRKMLIKAFILLLLAIISIGLMEFLSLRTYLVSEKFQNTLREPGLMGPALLVFFCAAGTCLFIPGTVFVGIGAILFGPSLGFACVWTGALCGATIAFLTTRILGREFVSSITTDRLKRYDDLIERNGFTAVLLLRLMCLPFGPTSYGLGLTKVRLSDYLLGTALGTAVTIFVVIFFIHTIKEIWISGDYGLLFSTRMALSIAFLLATALIVKQIQRKCGKKPLPAPAGGQRI